MISLYALPQSRYCLSISLIPPLPENNTLQKPAKDDTKSN